MIRSALLLFSVLLTTSISLAQVTIGHINLPNLAAADPAYAKIEQEVIKMQAEYTKKLQSLADEYQDLVNKFGQMSSTDATEQQLNELAAEAQAAESAYQKQAEEYDKLVTQKRDEMTDQLADKYEAAAKKVIKKYGLSSILRAQNNESVSIILHAPASADMSAEMKNELGIPLNDYDKSIPAFDVNSDEVAIAFTNLELLMATWPKAREVNAYLANERENMASDMNDLDEEFSEKMNAYNAAMEANSPEVEDLREELEELMSERQELANKFDAKLAQLRAQVMGPLLDEMQNAIDDVAAESGFTYVLNQTNSEGLSTILFGPATADITQSILAKLKVDLGGAIETPVATRPAKIGYVNVQKVLSSMKEVQMINDKIKTYRSDLYKKVSVKFEIVKANILEKEATLQRSDLTAGHRSDLQTEIEELKAELAKLEEDYARDVNDKEVQLLSPVLSKIQAAIDKEAEKNGLTVVINESSGTVVLIGSTKQNLTSKVIAAVK